jgi:hypothetical protein
VRAARCLRAKQRPSGTRRRRRVRGCDLCIHAASCRNRRRTRRRQTRAQAGELLLWPAGAVAAEGARPLRHPVHRTGGERGRPCAAGPADAWVELQRRCAARSRSSTRRGAVSLYAAGREGASAELSRFREAQCCDSAWHVWRTMPPRSCVAGQAHVGRAPPRQKTRLWLAPRRRHDLSAWLAALQSSRV